MRIEIPGDPIPLQRARAFKNRFYDPQYQAKKNYLSYVMEHLSERPEMPLKGAISLQATFYFAIPKSWSKKKKKNNLNTPCLKHVDLDNLLKMPFDVLNNHIWIDDSQIYYVTAIKLWAEESKTILNIIELNNDQSKN
jgi:Holliday junction resolvase RusA-like endonuclease